MAQKVIDTALSETYHMEAHDDLLVTRSGSILTDDWFGIDNQSGTAVRVQLAGRVQASAGIRFYSAPDADVGSGERSYVNIQKTGVATGEWGMFLQQGFGTDIRVAGTVTGSFGGIYLAAPDSTIRVLGDVRGDRGSALEITSQVQANPIGYCSVFNAGTLFSEESAAVSLRDAGGDIKNVATISGAIGIDAVGTQALQIKNAGTIFANELSGINIQYTRELTTIRNSGVIDAKVDAVNVLQADAHVVNSGTLTGERGLWVDGQSDLVLHNSGVITGEGTAIFSHGIGVRDVMNTGLIAGDIDASWDEGTYHLINHGTIVGDVRLGYHDDYYRLTEAGTMTGTVYGGEGEDILIGNAGADTLFGEGGDDRIRGRGGDDLIYGGYGKDKLRGGDGADVINGDATPGAALPDDAEVLDVADDVMTGGAGDDVFVFGANSGRDRVTDFGNGADVLRLVGHSGGFETLTIADRNDNLVVEHDNGTIVLMGQAGLVLTQADFDFV